MKNLIRKILDFVGLLEPIRKYRLAANTGLYTKAFLAEFNELNKFASLTEQRFTLNWDDRFPCMDEKTLITPFDRHYIYHPAWAARVLQETNPALHIDISSITYFAAIISAFIPVEFYEYRPTELRLSNLESKSADLVALPFPNNSVHSLSCMHTIEHVGLGRYGDKLDYDGDLKAMHELTRVLAKGGDLLFVTPIGKISKIMFNAHRVYKYSDILKYFSNLQLIEFALIPDDPSCGNLIRNATEELANLQNYGCGCFWFRK